MGLWGIASVPCPSLPPAFPCAVCGVQDHLAWVGICIRASYSLPAHCRVALGRFRQQSLCPIGAVSFGPETVQAVSAVPLHRPRAVQKLPGTQVSTADPWCQVSQAIRSASLGSHSARSWKCQDHTECSHIFPCISVCQALTTGWSAHQFLGRNSCLNTAIFKLVVLEMMLT